MLVVEDDHRLRDVLARGLRAEDFHVLTAVDARSALQTLTAAVDVIVLDIGLPDADGRDVCQAVRARGIAVPVIFVTARHQVDDRLSGFAAGGDDYLTKPFAFAELVARLRVALRRSAVPAPPAATGLHLDAVSFTLRHGSRRVSLTPIEFRLLAPLIARPGAVLRRRELMAAGWPVGGVVAPNTLDQYVRKIRARLNELDAPHEIAVVRGIGYRLDGPASRAP